MIDDPSPMDALTATGSQCELARICDRSANFAWHVSRVNEEDVLIAFMHPMAGEGGWARVGSRAPGAGLDDAEDAMANPETWISLAKLVHGVAADTPVPYITRQTY